MVGSITEKSTEVRILQENISDCMTMYNSLGTCDSHLSPPFDLSAHAFGAYIRVCLANLLWQALRLALLHWETVHAHALSRRSASRWARSYCLHTCPCIMKHTYRSNYSMYVSLLRLTCSTSINVVERIHAWSWLVREENGKGVRKVVLSVKSSTSPPT